MRKFMMRISMISGCVSLLAMTLPGLTTTHGQVVRQMSVTIPFDFIVGDKMLPAGQYTVGPYHVTGGALWSRLLIRSVVEPPSNRVIISSTIPIYTNTAAGKGRLIFNRYDGDRYFLSQIWVSGSSTGRQILKSGIEQKLTKNAPTHHVVSVVAQTQ